MKRKLKDFQKTKLKVGRRVTKGSNITDTSFQTRQIKITQNGMDDAMADKPLGALLKLFAGSGYYHKIETLQRIHNAIAADLESLHRYFPDILSKIGNALLESDSGVPELAVKIFTIALVRFTDAEFKAFSKTLMMHLSCMMSHGLMDVKKESLHLLEALLTTHPRVTTRYPKVLFSLLNMISVKRAGKQRKLVDHIHSTVTSLQWRQDVLSSILLFLKGMMDPEDDDDDDEEKEGPKEVQWDGETPLYLPLYSARGPVKVDFEWYAIRKELESVELKTFVFELTHVLGGLLQGELPHNMRVNQAVIISSTDAKYLNSIVQLLCYTGEWSQQNLKFEEEDEKKYSKQMQGIISLQLLRGFPYSQHGHTCDSNGRRLKEQDCVQLNLAICYLFNMFLLDSGDRPRSEKESVLVHLSDKMSANGYMSDKSILVILKMCRMLMKSEHVNESYKNGILVGLYGILETYKLSIHNKMLQTFFMELSLDYDYRDLLETQFMADWLTYLLKELGFMMASGKIDVEFLKYIRKLCAKKYPKFIETLSSFKQEDILKLLLYENEEMKLTIVHMIAAMDNIPASLFLELSDLISQDDALPLHICTKLIYFLHYRFSSKEASLKEKLQFVKFLLNIGCDTRSFRVPSEQNDEIVSELLFDILGQTKYQIYTTSRWKTHQKIYEACFHCLPKYCEDGLLIRGILMFVDSFYKIIEDQCIPIHMVLGILRVQNNVYHLFQDSNVIILSNMLIFSCFMYISVITNHNPKLAAEFFVPELQKLLMVPMCQKPQINILFELNEDFIGKFSDKEHFHFLRVIIFLNNRGKINPANPYMCSILSHLCELSKHLQSFKALWNHFRPTYR